MGDEPVAVDKGLPELLHTLLVAHLQARHLPAIKGLLLLVVVHSAISRGGAVRSPCGELYGMCAYGGGLPLQMVMAVDGSLVRLVLAVVCFWEVAALFLPMPLPLPLPLVSFFCFGAGERSATRRALGACGLFEIGLGSFADLLASHHLPLALGEGRGL